MTDFNLADIWELAAEIRGDDHTALVHGERRESWAELDRRADGFAQTLLGAGLGQGAKVAQYLYNCNEYIESVFGAFKAAMVPVNTNYRYADEELVYLFDNSDAEAVVFHGAFADRVAGIRPRVPGVRLWIHVDDGSGPCPDFALPYEQATDAARAPASNGHGSSGPAGAHVAGPWGRSGDDLYFLYTGGTTGMPKGVMWRQDDLFCLWNGGSLMALPEDRGMDGIREGIEALTAAPPVLLPACPLMHGTGAFTAYSCLLLGGTVVTLASRAFDASELLETIAREKVNVVTIVGDSFARPILAALEAAPGRHDLSSMLAIISSGVMWSEETKRALHAFNPNMLLVDAFSSSEALGMGSSVSAAGSEAGTASFKLGPNAKVIDEAGNDIPPGSGQAGRLALGGRLPLGYYKDAEKTARTFVTIGGQRYSVPGDYALVAADGTLQLLGRGSVVINSGGEKIFPEEVEEALKTHPGVADAACVGVPDERFGEAICAIVQLRPGEAVAQEALIGHVKERLASFKAPRHVVFV
ncbi:MAG TPA: AMP-binding protein, partial [Acidimicrobiales bacterium]|nr:AMP-binding protein [Acidimicrobiales bacterium]